MTARFVRRTHPGAARAPGPRGRRPNPAGLRATRPSAPDAVFVARIVLDMVDANARDERIDRFVATVVTRLQVRGVPVLR